MEINSLAGRRTLVDHVVEQVCANIESGVIKPGERMPTEFELGERFGVSRTVIREATRRLQSLGLIEILRGHGIFVGTHDSVRDSVRFIRSALAVSLADMEKFTDFRAAIENHTARQAALKATALDAEKLQRLCDELVAAVERGAGFAETQERDMAFHLEIAGIAGNDLIQQILQLVRDMIVKSMARIQFGQLLDAATTRSLHQAIVDAIRDRDSARAEMAMQYHMHEVLQRLRQKDAANKSAL